MLKNECIQLSTEINLSKKKEIKDIEKTLSDLNATLNLSDLQWEQKLKLESKLEELHKMRNEGTRIRAKIDKIENEIPNKSFFAIENNNATQKTITQLRNSEDEIIEGKNNVLKETYNFYFQLWGIDESIENSETQDSYVKLLSTSTLEKKESDAIEQLITEKEIELAINHLNKNSSPSSDGLTSEFYKTFAYLLKDDLVEILNDCYFKNNLTSSMKNAIVKLIHKKNDKQDLKNWRPISLVNTDYKILSIILAQRLTPTSKKIISQNQKCGLPGRRIEHILYDVQAVFEIAKEKFETFGVVLTDFEKAFDRMSHSFILKTFKELGYGPLIIRWLKIMYQDINSQIEINGAFTKPIKIKRGTRQRCPLSMLLFIAASGSLTRHIMQENQIMGFKFQGVNIKLTQYADDTTFFFTDLNSLALILKELALYECVSGQKLNKNKTQIYINDPDLKNLINQKHSGFEITQSVKLLGINFSQNDSNQDSNWHKTIWKIKSIIEQHKHRNLTIFGRTQIINSLVISQIVHKARIYIPSKQIIKELNSLIYSFLWYPNCIEQLSRKKLIADREKGGINLIDIKSKMETCRVEKAKALAKSENLNEIWKKWASYNLFYHLKLINKSLVSDQNLHSLNPTKTWSDVVKIVKKLKRMDSKWSDLTHKQIYKLLKSTEEKIVDIRDNFGKRVNFNEITLRKKEIKFLFDNKDKEVSYRIAHKAFKWGLFQRETQVNKNRLINNNKIYICKFCKDPNDSITHLMTECKPILKIWNELTQLLAKNDIYNRALSNDNIQYNLFAPNQQECIKALNAIVIAKREIIQRKLLLDLKNEINWDNEKFTQHVLWIINTKIKKDIATEKN